MGHVGNVECSQCGTELIRVIWNYRKGRPISEFFCNNACKGAWQKGKREALGFTREWLEDQYIQQRKGADQIAREIGRDPKRVWEWIRDYGIPRRPRGTDYGHGIKKGQESPFKGHKHSEEAKEKIRQRRLSDGRVPYLKGGVHWMKLPGAQKPGSWKGGVTPERQAFYSSQEWAESVKAVWARDAAICQMCGKEHNSEMRGKFAIHHIISFAYTPLRADPSNLILLCRPCHLWVHSRKNIEKQFIKEIPE